ncbi:RNA exonuclease 5 [Lutzomyia longipalpis]|uniref:RNA exonuclease 5 n=1 Tax=Lutzomyia longipalpis TaxID=7200 RepID=UPI0024846F95|nr:RNA exonuclease 5 [Lutzomyia longipalpis]
MPPTKQEIRIEKKMKKMAALAAISELNRREEASASTANPEPESKRPKIDEEDMSPEKATLTKEEYKELKKALDEKKRQLKSVPKIKLKTVGEVASLSVRACERTPIFLEDIQHLLMNSAFGKESPQTPWRWCNIEKVQQITQTVVLVIEGIYLYHFSAFESLFGETNRIFKTKLETVMPPYEDGRVLEEFASLPLTLSQQELIIAQYGSLEAALEIMHDPVLMLRSIFPIEVTTKTEEEDPEATGEKEKLPPEDVFSRTKLLLSPLQMVDEGYPLPLRGEIATKCRDYLLTKDVYKEVTSQSPMFGMDCEMCRTTLGFNELTRVSIVDEEYKPVYETLVMPPNRIIDYLTPYSGITADTMKGVTKTLEEVQQEIRELLPPDAILVGQSLNMDLNSLGMMHPYVIDTSVIYNLTGDRRFKSKLQVLAREFLGEMIQKKPEGHDSVEDSVATLKLTKLKLSKGIEFGDLGLQKRRKQKRKEENFDELLADIEGKILKKGLAKPRKNLSTLIVSSNATKVDYEKYIESRRMQLPVVEEKDSANISCFMKKSNKAAVSKTCASIMDAAFVFTHLKIDPKNLADDKVEGALTRVDQWIGKIWNSLAVNGLLVVLMGGSPISSSGVSLMEVKKLSKSGKPPQ